MAESPPRRPLPRLLLLVLAFLAAGIVLVFVFDPEPRFHPASDPLGVSERARALHRDAVVIDLHADSLLWNRDLTVRGSTRGHLDFPRMRRGGLDAVAFTFVTKFWGLAGLKALRDGWPRETWWSPWARLGFQLRRLERWADAGEIEIATDARSIRDRHRRGMLSAFGGVEGARALEGELARVSELEHRGVWFISPVHFTSNAYGRSSLGFDGGLTAKGVALIQEMNRAGVLLDLAHASPSTFREAIDLTELPPIVSHAGVRAVHDTWRTLSDEQIRAIGERGGVIGIMLAPPALRERSLDEALRHIEHVIVVAGEDVPAIGSDFDGYVDPPVDAEGLDRLTERMLRRGFTEERIRKVLGENVLRVLEARDRFRARARGIRGFEMKTNGGVSHAE